MVLVATDSLRSGSSVTPSRTKYSPGFSKVCTTIDSLDLKPSLNDQWMVTPSSYMPPLSLYVISVNSTESGAGQEVTFAENRAGGIAAEGTTRAKDKLKITIAVIADERVSGSAFTTP